ncbi:MAG: glycosyltransferase family 2 protein [Elusimicrobia bacterium]|nr:glycosyltransferase family 2 protein [Elusimicrobiota bacterium]
MFFFLTGLFYLLLSFGGLFKKSGARASKNFCKFAILIPCHNEENVIKFAIESLQKMDYPSDLHDIYVVADHCSDATAEIAGSMSAKVVYYDDSSGIPGKGRAMKWALENAVPLADYDAVCYFDADSLAHPKFLAVMNERLNLGEQVIQGHQLAKNTNAWMAKILAVGHIISNRFYQKPKYLLGLSATLHGKGMCFTSEVAKSHPWHETCLTEDLEMQMRLVKSGIRITWAEDALVYDEEPTAIRQYIKRTARWTKGALHTARIHLAGLFAKGIKEQDFCSLEAALWCSHVYRFMLVSVTGMLIYYTKDYFNLFLWVYHILPGVELTVKLFFLFPLVLYPATALLIEKVDFDIFVAYFMQPFLGFLRLPVFVAGILRNPLEWGRTEHTSRIAISDLVE